MPFLLLRCLRWAATLLLLASLVLPWFHVPVGVRETGSETYVAITCEPVTTPVFKLLVAIVLGIGLAAALRMHRSGDGSGRAALLGICGAVLFPLLLVLFPALTIQRCAETTAQAAWLQMQHDNLTFPGGDSYTAQEYSYLPGQSNTDINALPSFLTAIPNPPSRLEELTLARAPEIIMWLGFTPAFCQFASVGWFCALFGSSMLGFSLLRQGKDSKRFARQLSRVLPIVAPALAGICLLPVAIAGHALAVAREQATLGNFTNALIQLGRAEVWLPVLAYETDFIYQRGWLEQKCGFDTPVTQFVDAWRSERGNFDEVARQEYEKLLAPGIPRPVRFEAFRGLLRLAIDDFNSGLTDRAYEMLSHLAAIDPSSLTVLYGLQMTDLRGNRLVALRRDLAQFTAIYRVYQSPEKDAVLASGHQRLAELAFDHHNPAMVDEQIPLLTAPSAKP
jgi:hypothetical protein